MNTELAIGQIGMIDGVKWKCYKFTEHDGIVPCVDCEIGSSTIPPFIRCMEVACSVKQRSDHTDVYFKKIEE